MQLIVVKFFGYHAQWIKYDKYLEPYLAPNKTQTPYIIISLYSFVL